jgi:hypothetical protein
MTTIPTMSRIFADRYLREARRLEALHAGHISPGTKTWREAMKALLARMGTVSPVKQAALVNKATAYLTGVKDDDCTHRIIARSSASRSALLSFITFNAGNHPLVGVEEEGINVMQHQIRCDRNGRSHLISDVDLAYVSKHAIGRLHERECELTRDNTNVALSIIGALGYLTKANQKHITGAICLRLGGVLVVGSLKHSIQHSEDGRELNGTFYDVRTVLPADEVSNRQLLEQGEIAARVVISWFTNPPDDAMTLADEIPFLPRREDDYTLRAATVFE